MIHSLTACCSRRTLAAALAITMALLTRHASAQEPTAQDLRERLAELEQQITSERAEQADLEQKRETELNAQRERRAELADRVLDARLKMQSNVDRLRELKSDLAKATSAADEAADSVDAIRSAALSAAERLRIALSETPGNDAAIERLQSAARALNEPTDGPTAETLAALRIVTTELSAAHAAASSVTVKTASIYTATGDRETVSLLSIGLVRFAYVTDQGGRVGVALASPTDSSGYRWSEAINDASAQMIRETVATIQAGAAKTVVVPIDPTGRVQPETLASNQSLEDRARAGGPVMVPLALVALLAIALIVERCWTLYVRNPRGNAVATRITRLTRDGRADEAQDLAARSGGVVGRVLVACLSRRIRGQRAMEDSIQEQLLQELPRLNRFMGGIAILAAVAPLLGLLGTVTGIIATFGVIRAFGNANPTLMAGGISEALITTATGLTIAIPILIVHALLRGRADRVVADAERHAAALLTTLAHDHDPPADPIDTASDEPRYVEAGID